MGNKFCSKCGAYLNNDDTFCSKCGVRVAIEECIESVDISDSSQKSSNESKGNINEDFKSRWNDLKKYIKITFGVLEIIALIVVGILFMSGKFNLFITDFLAAINSTNDNPYIEMVQSLKPYDNMSYGSAFGAEFDYNEWSYFKSDGCRIVQVVSRYNDINDKMITQFLLTPEGEDQFRIEPYAVNVSGQNLSKYEIDLVIAAIFKNDLAQALYDLTENSMDIEGMHQEIKGIVNENNEENEKSIQEERKNQETNTLKNRLAEINDEISVVNRGINTSKNSVLEKEREIRDATTRIIEIENELNLLKNSQEVLAGTAPDSVWDRIRNLQQYMENNKWLIENRTAMLDGYLRNELTKLEEKLKELELEKEEIMKKLNN